MSASASAPGKVILFGEHAVVYGRPAIAVPLEQIAASVTVCKNQTGLEIDAADLGQRYQLASARDDDPLALAVRQTLTQLGITQPPAVLLSIHSSIPIASGLGSGAAVSVAIIRALARFVASELDDATVSELAYQVEKLYHGTPSGIDNTVIAYRRPVYFVRGRPIEIFQIETPFQLLIADTGIASPTRVTVANVRRNWQARPADYEALFDQIGQVADAARTAIERGQLAQLGPLMNRNQALLETLGVSSPELDRLIDVARSAGATGAKLSGGGGGGNLIALVPAPQAADIQTALLAAGAARVITSWIGKQHGG